MAYLRTLFPASLLLLQGVHGAGDVGTCSPATLDFIVLDTEQTLKDIEDDIRESLKAVGITVNARFLAKDEFNAAMVAGDFNLAFSESQGPPYDPQAFAASWSTADEAYYAALKGLPAPNTYDVMMGKIADVLKEETEAGRQNGWTEIFTVLHNAATELPLSGKRMPSVINKRLSGYRDGLQQYDYPLHTLRVVSGSKTVTVSPGSQTALFTSVGRLDPHTYRPNEFWASNLVYEGLVEYGPGGTILPALAASWTVVDCPANDANCPAAGQKYTFTLRTGVKFHDGADWDCSVAKLNFDHVLQDPLPGGCCHGWYDLMEQIKHWSCTDATTLVVTSKDKYYPFLQEMSFIRPLRMLSPLKFTGGATSSPLTQNSCAPRDQTNWPIPTETAAGETFTCAGVTGIAGTGRWKFVSKVDKTEMLMGSPKNDEVTFELFTDHWDYTAADWNVETLKIKAHADEAAVKAALLDGSLDAVIGAGVLGAANIVDFRDNRADTFAVSFTEPLQNRLVIFNTAKAPTDAIQMRKVIIHAIDKAAIVEKELKGIDQPVNQLFPKDAPYSNVHLTPVWDYDLQKAQLMNCPEPFVAPDLLTGGAGESLETVTDANAISAGALLAIVMAAFAQ